MCGTREEVGRNIRIHCWPAGRSFTSFHQFSPQPLFCADHMQFLTAPSPTSSWDSLTVNPAGQQVILFPFSLAFWYFPMIGLRPCTFSLETPEVTFSYWSLMLRHIAISIDASCHLGQQVTESAQGGACQPTVELLIFSHSASVMEKYCEPIPVSCFHYPSAD